MNLMYSMSVPVFAKTLGNLSAILDKAAAHAEAKKIDPAVLLAARLYPDMFPLTKQVQVACDFAKGTVARLAGEEPPKYDDNETTIEALKARIARTVDYVQGFQAARFAGAEERDVQMKIRDQTLSFKGLPYLAHMALPNFFFHATTAYDILRHNGVELGKRDFIGAI
ncbi:MAG TPA: DUF1993 family protein [Burkholderiaceae bacterium]|jgi:uncharacterized protein|nr:DUF1993 family protein [Burkholderiaceae bacterium]HQR77243.1 DUF1993 family protein [Burkholderiaceae bacterium]